MRINDNKLIKISAIVLIVIVVLQFFINLANFYSKYKSLKDMEVLNEFSIVVSELLHRTQQERGAGAGYIGSDGKKFKDILNSKIKSTNIALDKYQKFLAKNQISIKFFEKYVKEVDKYLKKLPIIRENIKKLEISSVKEIEFYSQMNDKLLVLLHTSIKETTNIRLAKSLMSYLGFERAKENIGIERAVLSAVFSQDSWNKGLYIKYIKLLTKQKVFLFQSLMMANKEIVDYYNKVMDKKTLKEVAKIEKIVLNKDKNFGIDAVYWYKLITHKLNLMEKVDILMIIILLGVIFV